MESKVCAVTPGLRECAGSWDRKGQAIGILRLKKKKKKCDKVKPPDKGAAVRGRVALVPEIKVGVGGVGSVVRRKEQSCEGQPGTA